MLDYQWIIADKNGTLSLVESVNRRLGSKKIRNLKQRFEEWWPVFEHELNADPEDSDNLRDDILDTLGSIVSGIKSGLKISEPNFRRHILSELRDLATEVAEWDNGEICIQSPTEGLEFLAGLYESARQTIFSTSEKRFYARADVEHNAMKRLLEMQKKSKARSTRVFLFESEDDIETLNPDFLQLNIDAGIDVRFYIASKHAGWHFPKNLPQDFTIIDNCRAIGVSEFKNDIPTAARWYFWNPARQVSYVHARKELERRSCNYKDYFRE